MAFSYSDKNFTVIGNLCFVHINLDGTKIIYNIPPAIADRVLPNKNGFLYPYFPENKVRSSGAVTPNIGFAYIGYDKIICSNAGVGYLSFCFPIDSNK